jgi:uroporphyrinogen decarboxylase
MPSEPTYRQLWQSIMHYGEFDRMPVVHWTTWPEAHLEWLQQGLPENVSHHQYLNASPMWSGVPVNTGLFPGFEEKTIEETAEYRIFRQGDGVVAQHWKNRSCIPHYIDFTMKDRAGWPEYKKRLQPCRERVPADLDEQLKKLKDSRQPVCIGTGSMVGWTRDWMGVENMAYACADDPTLIAEIADTVAELVCWAIDQVKGKVTIDVGLGWEDICFKNGPLVSPRIFKQCCVPAYRKVTDKLAEAGCDLYMVDCDGKVDALAPLWLEGGVNVLFPIEIGTWQADPMAYRRKYGKTLRIFGGIDKRELTKGRAAIDAEIARRVPLMKDGGFIPLPDHLVIPGTPLADYRYYLDGIRKLRF